MWKIWVHNQTRGCSKQTKEKSLNYRTMSFFKIFEEKDEIGIRRFSWKGRTRPHGLEPLIPVNIQWNYNTEHFPF
jgi:hypothetical protein